MDEYNILPFSFLSEYRNGVINKLGPVMLTDTHCRTARQKEKLYRLDDFNDLYLEVKPNGKKAWRYRFKLNGKSSMFALGEYPTVKLAEAREKCEQARVQVADGVSPTRARQ